MKTITINLYNFDELSKEAKEKAIEEQRKWEHECGFEFLSDDMDEKLKELLRENKLHSDNAKCFFSLGYCQGDGAMFEGSFAWKNYTIEIEQDGHYYHENSKKYDIQTRAGNYAKDSVYAEFEKLYQEICKQLKDHGYNIIEYCLSDEAIIENIQANEYTFEVDGTMHN